MIVLGSNNKHEDADTIKNCFQQKKQSFKMWIILKYRISSPKRNRYLYISKITFKSQNNNL